MGQNQDVCYHHHHVTQPQRQEPLWGNNKEEKQTKSEGKRQKLSVFATSVIISRELSRESTEKQSIVFLHTSSN